MGEDVLAVTAEGGGAAVDAGGAVVEGPGAAVLS
jgi:hypothetical protein